MTGDVPQPQLANDATEEGAGLNLSLRSIQVAGTELQVPADGVTIIVGGNNFGKSTLLREIHKLLQLSPGQQLPPNLKVIENILVDRAGAEEDLSKWLDANSGFVPEPTPGYVRFGTGHPTQLASLKFEWDQAPHLGAALTNFFVHYSHALTRSQMVDSVEQRSSISSPPKHPIHSIQDDNVLLAEMDTVAREIFRTGLTLDRLSGRTHFRIGSPSVNAPPVDSVTSAWIHR